jgi:hypothetical protein
MFNIIFYFVDKGSRYGHMVDVIIIDIEIVRGV